MMSLLDSAIDYARRGWSVIPIGKDKKPALRSWKPYQTRRPTEAELREWFQKPNVTGLAVVCGPVSGELVVRDFDIPEAYTAWARAYPDLAASLPTVQTGRGRHVYFLSDYRAITKIGKGEGELRGSGYVLLPPSLHPSGTRYKWLIPLPDGPLLKLDPKTSGLIVINPLILCDRETEKTNGSVSLHLCHTSNRIAIDKVIRKHLPKSEGQRNRKLFELARALRAIPELMNANDAKDIVVKWHRLAKPNITTKCFDFSWFDFVHAWGKVIFPSGANPLENAIIKAKAAPLPMIAEQFESEQMRLLVKLCVELSKLSLTGVFFLGCRDAGKAVGIDRMTASRWLNALVGLGVLEVVKKGNEKKAARYRYRDDVE